MFEETFKNRMLSRAIYVLTILFCSTLLAQEPGWVKDRPSDPDSYIGISFVEINNRPPSVYLNEADDQAILEISKQIQVQVFGEFKSIVKERGLDLEESYSQENLIYTVSNIKGLEKVDDKTIGNEYWVYWKVPKDAYEKSKQEAIKAARNQYIKFINTSNVNITQRCRLLITALDVLSQYPDSDIDLQNQVKNELNMLINRLNLEPLQLVISGTFDRRLDSPVGVRVSSFIDKYEGAVEEDLKEIPVYNFPLKVSFTKGKGSFTFTNPKTDMNGLAETQVTRIMDPHPRQEITFIPNLISLKPSIKPFPLLDKQLIQIAGTNLKVIEVDVLKERRLEVAIYVGSSEGFSNLEIAHLNDAFEEIFKDKTKGWIIRSREDADKEIFKQGYDPLSACTSRECRIAIVNILNIEELVLILMNYDSQKGIVTITMKLEDVKRDQTEIILRDTKQIPKDILFAPDYIDKNFIETWAIEFINKSNPSRSELIAGNGQNISMIINGNIDELKQLPYYDSFDPGTYNLIFFQHGYEQKDTTIIAVLGQPFNANITLRKKSRLKAFALSSLPGQGQRYSSDIINQGRKKTGLYYTIGGALAVIATGYTWYQYGEAVNNYNSSKSIYMDQNQMTEIDLNRSKTQNAHQKMTDNYQIAIYVNLATLGFWVFNMVEAAINLSN